LDGPVGAVFGDDVIQKYLSFARNFAVLKWNPWMEMPTIRIGDVLAVVIVLAAGTSTEKDRQ